MVAHLARVITELGEPLLVVVALERLEVRLAGALRIDDDGLRARQLHDEIGAQAAVVGPDVVLRLEIAVLEHAGHLDDAAELDLAPAAADVRPVAQRTDEVPGLAAQVLLALGEDPDLGREIGVGAGARDLELLELAVDLLERLLQRPDEMLDGLLLLPELRGGQLEERFVVVPERGRGERVEPLGQLPLGLLEQRHLLLAAALLVLQGDPERRDPRPDEQEHDACAEDESDDEARNHGRRTLEEASDGTAGLSRTTKMPDPTNP